MKKSLDSLRTFAKPFTQRSLQHSYKVSTLSIQRIKKINGASIFRKSFRSGETAVLLEPM